MIGCDIAVKINRSNSISLLNKIMKNWSIPEKLINKPFISPKDLCIILNVSLPTIYRLIDARKIPAFKIGNSIRFLKEDVVSYLEQNRIDQIT